MSRTTIAFAAAKHIDVKKAFNITVDQPNEKGLRFYDHIKCREIVYLCLIIIMLTVVNLYNEILNITRKAINSGSHFCYIHITLTAGSMQI